MQTQKDKSKTYFEFKLFSVNPNTKITSQNKRRMMIQYRTSEILGVSRKVKLEIKREII